MFDEGNSLPLWVLLPCSVVFTLLHIAVCRRTNNAAAVFVISALWLRYMMSAYHLITYRPLLAGLSLNALGSIAIFGWGALVARPQLIKLKILVPVYLLVLVIVVSSLINHTISGCVNTIVKYGYFTVVMLGTYEALRGMGRSRFMPLLISAFIPPLTFQLLSVLLHVSKATETDGSVSYIGGYNHEAAFSVAIATCLVIVCLADDLRRRVQNVLIFCCLVGLFLANYRTSILAMAPLLAAHYSLGTVRLFKKDQRVIVATAMSIFSVLVFVAAGWVLRERFADLFTALASPGSIIKDPSYFTHEDMKFMSGRPGIWSHYIYSYLNGNDLQMLFGFGPDSWMGVFNRYAHNTLVSYLYELGVIGVLAVISLWMTMLSVAVRIKNWSRVDVIAAHLSFILLNLATMPHWLIEGNILYGVLCGYSLYLLRAAPATESTAAARLPLRPELSRTQTPIRI